MTLLRAVVEGLSTLLRAKATDAIELELRQAEALFALLVVGGIAGLPSPPPPLALALLPHLSREVEVLLSQASLGDDALARLASTLDVG